MKRYLVMAKGNLMAQMAFRMNFIMTGIGAVLYVPITYFLWNAVYMGSKTKLINGMSFNDVFVYLIFAAAVFALFFTRVEWIVAPHIMNGDIVIHLTKPLDYQLLLLFSVLGVILANLAIITIPSLLVFGLIFKPALHVSVNSVIFFGIALILSFLISFNFDYITGIISFYTQSLLGVITAKEAIVMLLSGVIIPLSFFPETLRRIVWCLPFQAVINVPLTILISPHLSVTEYLRLLSIQVFWAVILFIISRLLYSKAIRHITVSGG